MIWAKPTIYHTRGEHANNYATDEVQIRIVEKAYCFQGSILVY